MWDDGIRLHQATELVAGNAYRCASPGFQATCHGGRSRYRQDSNGHLTPAGASDDLVRCVGPRFEG
jgi:hypothetical protein